MRRRILPFIGLSFGLLVLSRAVDVSSEVLPPKVEAAAMIDSDKAAAPNLHAKDQQAEDPQVEDLQVEKSPADALVSQCLTGAILETLSSDMERLDIRETQIKEREVALAAIEKTMAAQMEAVDVANKALQVKIDQINTLANDDLKHLVGMYQTMKPKQAAEIFNSMDPAFAAGFLREMSSEKAGFIMANMDARRSYTISVIIAGKNANYRKKN